MNPFEGRLETYSSSSTLFWLIIKPPFCDCDFASACDAWVVRLAELRRETEWVPSTRNKYTLKMYKVNQKIR
ncbi:hypothetical protein CH376_06025 [Leptospira adleri]|uniref:DUF1564 family protein n=1 Tax=Leptospira adleri TaxID=2023186 RepID=A0ABX4P196_9LEPT|nr:hypothetical protein CH376_06025 [Leptospira adleri]